MKSWHFNVLFFVGVGGAVLLLMGKSMGLDIDRSPMAASGIGAILTFILTQKLVASKHEHKRPENTKKEEVEKDGS